MNFKFIALSIVSLLVVNLNAATGDTTYIQTHVNSNLASPPSSDDFWVVFPNNGTSYQKIIMKFVLGCGTPNCSGWDYTVTTSFGKKDGTVDSTIASIDTLTLDTTWNYSDHVDFYEAGRLITPYGTYMANNSNGFNNQWTHPYYYDVTDFAKLLRDSVNVRVRYDGWTDAFSANIEFILIEGPSNREVVDVKKIYDGYFDYPNTTVFEQKATPKPVFIPANVTSAKLLVYMTGHGSQGEFDPHSFYVSVNNEPVYSKLLWKSDCGFNAIAPQGGTWVFNRANWCPGEQVPVYEIDITSKIHPGQYDTINLDFDDYSVGAGESAGYGTSVHLITYSSQQENDVMLEDILSPSNDKQHLHFNPISTNPRVRIKNTGKQPLTYAEISYWVKGGVKWYYEWNGFLPPFESEIVTLPAFDWNGLDTNDRVFFAEVAWPNQTPDIYTHNNKLSSAFDMAPQTDEAFIIYFKANNRPEENWYVLRNEDGDTIYFKNTFTSGAISRDTVYLAWGSYSLDFNDYDAGWDGGDGISWWLNTQNNLETSGQFNLRKLNSQIFKNFNGDFGSNIHYEFTVGYPLGYNNPKQAPNPPQHPTGIVALNDKEKVLLNAYPNPASSVVNLSFESSEPISGELYLQDMQGRTIKRYTFYNSTSENYPIQTKEISNGLYLVVLKSGNKTITQKLSVAK